MFKNSKKIVPIAIHMLFARNDQYHNYNTRQSRSLHPSVGRGEAIQFILISWSIYMELSIKTYSSKY